MGRILRLPPPQICDPDDSFSLEECEWYFFLLNMLILLWSIVLPSLCPETLIWCGIGLTLRGFVCSSEKRSWGFSSPIHNGLEGTSMMIISVWSAVVTKRPSSMCFKIVVGSNSYGVAFRCLFKRSYSLSTIGESGYNSISTRKEACKNRICLLPSKSSFIASGLLVTK